MESSDQAGAISTGMHTHHLKECDYACYAQLAKHYHSYTPANFQAMITGKQITPAVSRLLLCRFSRDTDANILYGGKENTPIAACLVLNFMV